MKKQALIKDAYREIQKSLGRFLSILLIVAVGVGFFTGVKATAPSMYQTADQYFGQNRLMDLEILSTVGFDDADVQAVQALDGVAEAMPSYSADLLLPVSGQMLVTKTMALPDAHGINLPRLTGGRMPENEQECLISSSNLADVPFELGQQITFAPQAGTVQTDTVLSRATYTIVGFADLPQYISYSYGTSSIGDGTVSCFVLIPASNFLYSRYTEMYVTLSATQQGVSAFDAQYDAALTRVIEKIEALWPQRYQIFLDDSQKQLDQAEDELEQSRQDARDQLEDAAKQLDQAREEIEAGLDQLEQGWEDYKQGNLDAREQIETAQQQIDAILSTLKQSERQILNSKSQYAQAQQDVETQLADGRRQLDDGWQEYRDGLAKFNEQKAVFDEYLNEYQRGEAELAAGKAEYADALEQYNDAQDQLLTAKDTVTSLKEELEAYKNGESGNVDLTQQEIAALRQALEESKQARDALKAQLDGMDPESEEYAQLQTQIEQYDTYIAQAEQQLENLENGEDVTVSDEIIAQMEAAIAEAETQIADYETQLDDAKAQLDDAQDQIDAGEAELNQAYLELSQAQAQLDDAKAQLDDAKVQLEQGEAELETQRIDAYAQLDDALLQMRSGKTEITRAYDRVRQALLQLADSKMDVAGELDAAEQQLLDSQQELDAAQQEYQQGLEEYQQAVSQVEQELSSGMNRIQNTRQSLREVISGKWYVFGRDDIMVNYSSFKLDAQRISAIANVFPIFFLMVAALVCLTTMSRMVDERRTEMGTYKALGYSQRDIIAKYLIYAALACFLGSALGAALCVQVLPRVIFSAYSILYALPDFSIKMPWGMLAVSFLVALLCTVLVAFICCWKELKVTTAALMRPKAPKAGKRIWMEHVPKLWNRLSFSKKLTMRNLFRYKARLLMTVIGIAGCMALIVAGFGLNNAISPIVDLQYGQITQYDVMISLDQNYDDRKTGQLRDALLEDPSIACAVPVYEFTGRAYDVSQRRSMDETYLFMPRNVSELSQILNLRQSGSGGAITLGEDSVVITEKLAEKLGVLVGGQIVLMIDEQPYTLQVGAIAENYINNYIYMAPQYYQQVFGREPVFNTVYATSDSSQMDADAFTSQWLEKESCIVLIFFTEEISGMVADTFDSLKLVVVVIILCAGILAFIVLYNLTNINISERVREIATIKVLGFKHSEVNMYIFRENLVMCVLGIVGGGVLGYFMAQYIIATVEVDMVTFVRQIRLSSYLYGGVLTLAFTLLVNWFMTGKMKAISMVESLKAIE